MKSQMGRIKMCFSVSFQPHFFVREKVWGFFTKEPLLYSSHKSSFKLPLMITLQYFFFIAANTKIHSSVKSTPLPS